ncbi:MAG: Kelch repeat-containing protein [Spirochaetota bacterium]
MRRNCTWALALLLSTYCSQPTIEKVELSKARTGFRLTDGSAISSAEYAEYNPQLIQRPDGKLSLIFASDRPCAGCSAGMHNLFIAVSVDEYLDDLQMPEFNTPVAIRPNGSTLLNSAQRIRFGAVPFSGNIGLAYEVGAGTYSFELSPATQVTGAGIGHGGIGNSTRSTDSFLGFGPEVPSMISRDGSLVVRYSKVDSAHNGRSPDNFLLSSAENVSTIPSSVTGFNTALLIADAGGVWFSTLQFPLAPAFGVNIALLEADLLLSNANVSATTAGFADFLLFSADDGVSDDMYVVTSHSVADLWFQDTFLFGDFSDSASPRNVWTTLSATVPSAKGHMAAAVLGDKAYLIGGTADGSTATNTIYEFDFLSETFTNCGSTCGTWPTNVMNATAVGYNGLVYVFGGSVAAGAANSINNTRYFEPAGPSVTGLTGHSLARANAGAALVNNRMYILGGISNSLDCNAATSFGCTNNHYYDLGLNSWSSALTAVSHNFSNGATAAFGSTIMAFGGLTNSGGTVTNAVSQYDADTDAWTNCGAGCTSLATARDGLAAVTHNTSAYIVGGQNGATYYTLVEEYDFLTQTQKDCDGGCEPLPGQRSLGSLLAYGGKLYYFGGMLGGSGVNTIYVYTP